jgi:predicted TIM-barrel fold metal-dependent hydrolase
MSYRPWFLKSPRSEPEPAIEPPLCMGSYSNGEYFHQESARDRLLKRMILERADRNARKVGMDRRAFLTTAMGMATSLAVIDQLAGCGDAGSNGHLVPTNAGVDAAAACAALDTSGLFIFDIQTHHINPLGPWRETNQRFKLFVTGSPQASCALDGVGCFSAQHYVEQIFINSDTKVAVLSLVPALPGCTDPGLTPDCGLPLENQEAVATRELVAKLARSQRMLNHCLVLPNVGLQQQLQVMEMMARQGAAAFKLYPGWGPNGVGYFVDEPEFGVPVIQKARDLGVKIICAHKGLPLQGFDPVHNHPRDMAAAAKMFPDVTFIVYHSAFNYGASQPMDIVPETPFDPMDPNPKGTNTLIKSMMEAGLAPGANLNLYAELGGAWSRVMSSPDQAAHLIGKLVKYFGPDNVLWGTDCIWTGSPQAQIEAFWAFTIGADFQERYGYPALTDDIKRKILGLNAARVYKIDVNATRCAIDRSELAMAKRLLDAEIGGRRWALNGPAGPRTYSEYLRMNAMNGNRPG